METDTNLQKIRRTEEHVKLPQEQQTTNLN